MELTYPEEAETFRGEIRAWLEANLPAQFFFSRSETIWGGTAEVQRNIVGERVLGLPKEPKPENELPNG